MGGSAILVVGAGFAGATYARTLAEAGWTVDVIDRREHIAGNAFDAVDGNGVRVHRYGPHLFHTNATHVFSWLRRFGEWLPYRHRVRARLGDGRLVPMPVNLDTINAVFGTQLADPGEAEAFLLGIAEPIAAPRNAGEYLRSRIGPLLTDLFFRPYTRKMWALELEELDASVVKRLPIRLDCEDAYFPEDAHQVLPRDGYAAVVARILDHPAIRVSTATPYGNGLERDYRFCFNSMAIDEYFDCSLGELPYRSLRFHHRSVTEWDDLPWSVRNYTDDSRYTRETWWHCLPGHLVADTGQRTMTVEEPCDYRDNAHERYYPVRTADQRHQRRYREYRALADRLPAMAFIGRCGTYQYLDMDQVIAQSLGGARRWLELHR